MKHNTLLCDMANRYYNQVAESGSYDEYAVFSGVQIFVNHIHSAIAEPYNKETKYKQMMKIEYCTNGRYECEFEHFGYVYLGCGDMAISTFEQNKLAGSFPTGYYEGVTVLVDMEKATKSLSGFPFERSFDLYQLKEIFRLCGGYFMQQATKEIKQIFLCMANPPEELRAEYLQLKTMELLLLLHFIDHPSATNQTQYFPRRQVEATKRVREYLISHMAEHPTIPQAAKEVGINTTLLKSCFKVVYGNTIGCYMREYRIRKAALLLKTTNETVYSIANRVGYTNQSKFAASFKKIMGVTPLQYRNNDG